MDYKEALNTVIVPGLALLPAKFDTPEARVMLLAIGMQESRFEHRKQIGGPAHGFYQFERGGGVRGVLNHRWTKPLIDGILAARGVKPEDCYNCIVDDDALATVFARLLLYTDPAPLPKIGQADIAYNYYLRNWKPGKPKPDSWPGYYVGAIDAFKG